VYEYSIPESVDKAHMKIQIACYASDWTFYDPSYFSDLEFVVDKVELFSAPPPPPPPVGGYSVPIKGYLAEKPLTPYLASITILIIGLTTIRRKATRKTE